MYVINVEYEDNIKLSSFYIYLFPNFSLLSIALITCNKKKYISKYNKIYIKINRRVQVTL